jgi:hypothetical protein
MSLVAMLVAGSDSQTTYCQVLFYISESGGFLL